MIKYNHVFTCYDNNDLFSPACTYYVDVYVKGSDKKSPGNNVHYRLILIGIYYVHTIHVHTNVINIDFSFFKKDEPKGPR